MHRERWREVIVDLALVGLCEYINSGAVVNEVSHKDIGHVEQEWSIWRLIVGIIGGNCALV